MIDVFECNVSAASVPHQYDLKLEIRSMERDIRPIVVLYLQQNVLALHFKNFVGQQGYKFYHIFGHVTSSLT